MDQIYPYRIRDAIHGFIHFNDNELDVINSPEFQRLRRIKQLALTSYVYPGAMHTRFEHSLGVMELSSRAFDQLQRQQPSLISENFSKIGLTCDQARAVLRMAALLHDVGHLPFSHGAEGVLPTGKKHEDVSIVVINSMQERIDKLLFSGASKIIVQLIQQGELLPELTFLKKLLSGQIDADRMDYLLRDSHYCGVDYGKFDFHRLLETLQVVRDENGGLDLAISRGGVQTLEALIMARYYMFAQVYCHRTRRIYDIYLEKYMSLRGKDYSDLLHILRDDDYTIMAELRTNAVQEAFDKGGIVGWAGRIFERRHHSLIIETNNFASAVMKVGVTGIYQELSNKYKEYNFILDMEAKGTIHKFYVPGEEDIGEQFYVASEVGDKLITDESRIIRQMPKKFHVVRLYVDCSDQIILKQIRDEAKEMKNRRIKE